VVISILSTVYTLPPDSTACRHMGTHTQQVLKLCSTHSQQRAAADYIGCACSGSHNPCSHWNLGAHCLIRTACKSASLYTWPGVTVEIHT
jgi:hypothetical protein